MEESLTLKRLTILYTGGLRGDLALLPRLYTQIKRLRGAESADRFLLIDIGDSCSADVWHCAVTGGRSMIVALDGMGYDIVYAELSAEARAKLGDNVRVDVIAQADAWISSASIDAAKLTGDGLIVPALSAGQVGRVRLELPDVQSFTGRRKNQPAGDLPPEWFPKLISNEIFDLPPATPPDPTIAGVIEFILSEARYTQKKNANSPRPPDTA